MSRIGILLDFDGTIIGEVDWARVDMEEGRRIVSGKLDREITEEQMERFSTSRGHRSWRLLREDLEVSKKKYWEAFSEAQAELKIQQLERGRIETCDLEKLRKVEKKAVVSNSPGQTLDRILEHLGIDDEFVAVEGPRRFHEHRYMKPDTFLLERAMDKFDTELFVMVGNSWRDEKAAENSGIAWRTVETLEDTDRILEKYY